MKNKTKKLIIALLFGVCLTGAFVAIAMPAMTPVGYSQAEASVNQNGGANYSVPIYAPPGTAGKTPSLTLTYNVSGANPLYGLGFSVSGLSAIHRCNKTIALDGLRGGINYDTDDRFCLDGQRLIAVSGTYGANQTEYRTERESFTKIVSYGDQSGGPHHFKAFAKDGSVTEYGVSDDARIEAQGKSLVRVWAANKTIDTDGNYQAISYTEDNTTGEYRPNRIDYTGNEAANLAPYNSIRFVYEDRPDITTHYEGGALQRITKRLKTIQSYADTALAREYRLSYNADGSLILPTDKKPGFEGWSWTSGVRRVDDGGMNFMADVNGDGKKDHVFVAPAGATNAGAVHVGLSTDGGFQGWTSISASRLDPDSTVLFDDVNGDSKEDLVFITGATGNFPGQVHVGLSSGSGFTFWDWTSGGRRVDDSSTSLLGDVNGDGKADLINITGASGSQPGRVHVGLSNGNSFAGWSWMTNSRLVDDGSKSFVADVSGDGKADLVNITGTSGSQPGRVHIGLSNGTAFQGWTWMTEQRLVDDGSTSLIGDVSGDGKADLVNVTGANGTQPGRVHIGLSDGSSFGRWSWMSEGRMVDNNSKHFLGDVNGDGKADFISIAGPGSTQPGRPLVGLSRGDSFEAWTWYRDVRLVDDDSTSFAADTNGDHRADLVNVTGATGNIPGKVHIGLGKDMPLATSNTNVSRLTSIQECGANNQCMYPTELSYQGSTVGFTSDTDVGSYTGMSWRSGGNHWGDVNGDGKADLVYLEHGTSNWRVRLSTGTGFGADSVWGTSTQSIKWDTGDYPRLTDVDADGKADLVYYQAGTGATFRVLRSTGNSFAADEVWGHTTSGISSYGGNHQFFFVDVNGDAKADIVYLEDGTARWRAALSSTTGTTLGADVALGTQSHGTVSAGGYHAHYWADMNGDGKTDLLYQQDGTSIWRVMLSTGSSLGADTAWGTNTQGIKWDTGDGPRVQDINGDSKADLVYYQAGTGATFRVLYSTGKGFAGDQVWGYTTSGISSYGGSHQFFLTEVNGDGKPDIVYLEDGTAKWRAALSSGGSMLLGSDASFGAQTGGTISENGQYWHAWNDVTGDGKADLTYFRAGTSRLYMAAPASEAPDLLVKIKNGIDKEATFMYKPLTDGSVYTPGSAANYPYQNVQNATRVVSKLAQSDGLGGSYDTTYQYKDAKQHLSGPGWLGFAAIEQTDGRNGLMTRDEYSQDYNAGLQGSLVKSEIKQGSAVLKRKIIGLTGVQLGGGRVFVREDNLKEEVYDLNGASISCAETTNTFSSFDEDGHFGNYGNPTTVRDRQATDCTFSQAFSKTISNTYEHDTTRYILGKRTRAETLHQASGQPDEIQTSTFTYTPEGHVATEITEPNSALWSKRSYNYDVFGNQTRTAVSGPDIAERVSTRQFDSQGRFELSHTNAAGHTTHMSVDAKWGKALTSTDPNGDTTTYQYDEFGRPTQELRPDGTTKTTTYTICKTSGQCPTLSSGAVLGYVVTTHITGSSPQKKYHDILDREVRTEAMGFDGMPVYEDTWYNNLGQPTKKSRPYAQTEAPVWQTTTYDSLGRATSTTDGAGVTTATTYNGTTSTETVTGAGISGRSRTVVKNALDKDQQVTDSKYPDKPTNHTYDALGNIVQIVGPTGSVTSFEYDARGKKTRMSDPDLGTWNYSYNSVGEVISQTDAKGQEQTVTYDSLGRIASRTTAEGTSTWQYDTSPNGVGKQSQLSGPGGYQETYAYDDVGRKLSSTTTIDNEAYTHSVSYNSSGQVATQTYPTGFAIKNVYSSGGHLVEIRNNQTNQLYWRADQADARGNLTKETLGNGLTTQKTFDAAKGTPAAIQTTDANDATVQDLTYAFDVLGNLVSHTDETQDLSETFAYDELNRLTTVDGPNDKTIQYDAAGNITQKSDVGQYTYPAATDPRPHAVAQITGPQNSNYTYDANGNLLAGGGRTISYTSFNKPLQISTGDTAATYSYDANFNRIKKATPTSTTVYIGESYERVTTGSMVEHKHYIGDIAVYTKRSNNTEQLHYILKDHLGSPETITDQNGQVVQKLSFDAFGQRRNSNWADASGPISSVVTRGFTGHEMEAESGLVNMNARLYDPTIGRFLQPDTLAEGDFGQHLNRFSYAKNNPLSYTDPTGHLSFGRLVRTVVSVVVTFYCPVCGAILQGVLAKADGASWSQAFKVAVVSYATGEAGRYVGNLYSGGTFGAPGTLTAYTGRAVAQGVIGGAASKAMGGSFNDGFKQGFSSSLKNSLIGHILKRPEGSDPKLASKDAVYKPDPAQMIPGSEYYEKATKMCPHLDVCDWSAANTGEAVYALTADKIGQPVAAVDATWTNEAGPLRYLAKFFPGAQAFSNSHDTAMGTLERRIGSTTTFNVINKATIPLWAYAHYRQNDYGYSNMSYRHLAK